MDILAQLGVALGLASLAGVNLYLTVLLTGLAVRFNFVQLAAQYQSLDVLAHPLVIIVAGLLFVMQFFADKIPWVDSLWDSVHTVIRPVGGTLLALEALGTMPVYVSVTAALIAGGAALTTHSAKAATRLLINHSPEPATNVAMSLAEEATVAGGVALTLLKPVIALMVFGGLLVVIWMIYPRLWRLIRTTMWLVWHKLKLPGRLGIAGQTGRTGRRGRRGAARSAADRRRPCAGRSGLDRCLPLGEGQGSARALREFVGNSRRAHPPGQPLLRGDQGAAQPAFQGAIGCLPRRRGVQVSQ